MAALQPFATPLGRVACMSCQGFHLRHYVCAAASCVDGVSLSYPVVQIMIVGASAIARCWGLVFWSVFVCWQGAAGLLTDLVHGHHKAAIFGSHASW